MLSNESNTQNISQLISSYITIRKPIQYYTTITLLILVIAESANRLGTD